ncbi:MAG TPA: hypothetical protein VJ976_07575 [Ornithinimicrobium sp.]|uniref:hypothetical protein n=1 Tax=Ornithinimicrobium sp. TaxID=1977084 RepID=UPI002B4819EF|nr:hypothetical protein [Ornithinimicrobium sp.]HKJ12236.1 hypothetical protein [Ornithinimicrobium sp.]
MKAPAATVGAGFAAAVVAGAVLAGPAQATPQGFTEEEFGVGYFYGTFDADPGYALLVGGSAEEFCEDGPDDPFGTAEPGSATARVFTRNNGTVVTKVNSRDQPLYLYVTPLDGPSFITEFCDIYFDDDPTTSVPDPVASGTANLKVRNTVLSESTVDIFNSVNGFLTAGDGTEYKVRASVDVLLENGAPTTNPVDFVNFSLTEIRR